MHGKDLFSSFSFRIHSLIAAYPLLFFHPEIPFMKINSFKLLMSAPADLDRLMQNIFAKGMT